MLFHDFAVLQLNTVFLVYAKLEILQLRNLHISFEGIR